MQDARAKILSNVKIASRLYRMVLEALSIARVASPGQFLHIRCTTSYDPLLRRPFSVHRIKEGSVEILYRVVGKGTEVLSQRKAGEELSILGPLGSGFPIEEKVDTAILVAGGIGIAPLICLAEKLVSSKKVYALVGARTKELILYEKELKGLGIDVRVATDDGSYGKKGMVTDLLRELLSTIYSLLSTIIIYACGPRDMLREVAQISKSYGIRSEASFEENMGCGLGACMGCVIKVKSNATTTPFVYKRVCKDGPIFNLDDVVWE